MRFSHRFLTGAVVLSILGTLCFHPITAEARRMTAAEQAAAEAAEAERQAVYNKAVDSNSIEAFIIRIWIWSITRPASPRL